MGECVVKKLLSILLVLCISVSLLAGVSFAVEIVGSGTCGTNVSWTLDSDGVLTISGTGAMEDYSSSSVPWANIREQIKKVVIKYGVTSVGRSAFYDCDLTSVTIPESVTSIGNSAFYDCDYLKSVVIPDSVTSIGEGVFTNCGRLTTVTIGESVTSIGRSAFYGCDYLKSVVIPDSVTSIGELAFYLCDNLTTVTIGNGVTSIPDKAFYSCKSLASVAIGNSVTGIGEYAFYYCESLTSVAIPDSVTSIGEHAFSYCRSLTTLTIGDSVTKIGYRAFLFCESLTSVTIPNSVTSIGEYAFYYCESLTSVTIGDGVTSIGGAAFSYCTSLSSITIPDSVTSISYEVFSKCYDLTAVVIPDSVTSIGRDAFYECSALTDVYYGGTQAEKGRISIYDYNTPLENAMWHYTTKFDVLISSTTGGVVSANKKIAAEGKTVLLTAKPNAGYRFKTFFFDGVAIEGNTFIMPAKAVNISAQFEAIDYDVTVGDCENGSITVDKLVANVGDTIRVIASPSAGYRISKVYVNGTANTTGTSFTMPANNVTVTAEFVKIQYSITVQKPANGSVAANKASAGFDTEITLSATPNTGYRLVQYLLNGGAISGNTFVMPKSAVTVSAEFSAIDYNVTVGDCGNGGISVDKEIANIGDVVTVTPNVGYQISTVFVNGSEISGSTFTMPACDVVITAELIPIISTINGAQIRTRGNQGLRFIATIDKTSADFDRVAEYGIVLIPSADITDISELEIGATFNGHTVAKVPAKKIYSETASTITFTAVITDIKEINYAREYTARAYAIIDDGSVVYSDTGASRSIYAVAKRGLDNPNELETNKEVFRKIVLAVEGASGGDSGIY